MINLKLSFLLSSSLHPPTPLFPVSPLRFYIFIYPHPTSSTPTLPSWEDGGENARVRTRHFILWNLCAWIPPGTSTVLKTDFTKISSSTWFLIDKKMKQTLSFEWWYTMIVRIPVILKVDWSCCPNFVKLEEKRKTLLDPWKWEKLLFCSSLILLHGFPIKLLTDSHFPYC